MSFISTYSAASIRAWQSPSKTWTFYDDITKPSTTANTSFGSTTAVDENGNYIVVGSANAGVLTIVSGSSYSTVQTITPSYANSRIGLSIAINFNGTAIVGVDRPRGNVVIFNRTGNTWAETQVIPVSNLGTTNQTCTIDDTANYIAISSNNSALIYSNVSNTWTLQDTLNVSTSINTPLVFNKDAAYLAAGDTAANGSTGQVKVFTRSGNSWSLQANITASIPIVGTLFGSSITINNEADVIMIGAPSFGTAAGAVYAYNRTGNTWTQTQIIQPSDTAVQQAFGISLQLDGTGTHAIIGAAGFDGSGNTSNNQGKVYFFENINNTWQEIQSVQSPNISNSEFFGESVSLSKNNYVTVIGAPGNDIPNLNVGASYIYLNS